MSIDNTILEFKLPPAPSTVATTTNILNIISSPSSSISSCIAVNVKELNLKIYNEIVISWNIVISDETTVKDWIGIYKADAIKISDYLDIKILDSYNGSKIGHLTWQLSKLKTTSKFQIKIEDGDFIEFRYYNGVTNRLLAKSAQLKFTKYKNENELITCCVTDIKANQLRKGMFFNPDPYVKIYVHSPSLSTNGGQNSPSIREFKTNVVTNTCFPSWKNEVFTFESRENDRLIFEVKDKFAKTKPSINRFLGRISVDFGSLINKARLNNGRYQFTFKLSRRNSNDNVFSGYLSFSLTLLSPGTSNITLSNSSSTRNNQNNDNSTQNHVSKHRSIFNSKMNKIGHNHQLTKSLIEHPSTRSDSIDQQIETVSTLQQDESTTTTISANHSAPFFNSTDIPVNKTTNNKVSNKLSAKSRTRCSLPDFRINANLLIEQLDENNDNNNLYFDVNNSSHDEIEEEQEEEDKQTTTTTVVPSTSQEQSVLLSSPPPTATLVTSDSSPIDDNSVIFQRTNNIIKRKNFKVSLLNSLKMLSSSEPLSVSSSALGFSELNKLRSKSMVNYDYSTSCNQQVSSNNNVPTTSDAVNSNIEVTQSVNNNTELSCTSSSTSTSTSRSSSASPSSISCTTTNNVIASSSSSSSSSSDSLELIDRQMSVSPTNTPPATSTTQEEQQQQQQSEILTASDDLMISESSPLEIPATTTKMKHKYRSNSASNILDESDLQINNDENDIIEDRLFFENISKELKEIAETIKNSKKNNISYDKIESDIQKTYINKVLNKCQQHKCFHLIKTNSQYTHTRKRSSLQAPTLFTLRNTKQQRIRQHQEKSLNNNEPRPSSSSLSSILMIDNQQQTSKSSTVTRQSFLKKHEQNDFKLKRLSQQNLYEMIEIGHHHHHHSQQQQSLSASNLLSETFEQQQQQQQQPQTTGSIMSKTYKKNKADAKLKIININKMFKKCQQQQPVLETNNNKENSNVEVTPVNTTEPVNIKDSNNKSLLGNSLNEWTLKFLFQNQSTSENSLQSSIISNDGDRQQPMTPPHKTTESSINSNEPTIVDVLPTTSSQALLNEERTIELLPTTTTTEDSTIELDVNKPKIQIAKLAVDSTAGVSSATTTAAAANVNNNETIQSLQNELPAFWEARIDNLGRVFYIDHSTRSTTWKKPKINTNTKQVMNDYLLNSELEKQRLDKRYQSIRRTMNQAPHSYNAATAAAPSSAASSASSFLGSNNSQLKHLKTNSSLNQSPPPPPTTSKQQAQPEQRSHSTIVHSTNIDTSNTSISTPAASSEHTSSTAEMALLSQPGLKFITRSDLHQVLRQNPQAKELTKQSVTLASMLQKIRSNPLTYYKKYQHNKELVRFLNMFADPSKTLPMGWEMKYDKNNKVFFVDHNSRSTTFIDPRLPLSTAQQNALPPPVPPLPAAMPTHSTIQQTSLAGAAAQAAHELSNSNSNSRISRARSINDNTTSQILSKSIHASGSASARLSPPSMPPPPPPPPLPVAPPPPLLPPPALPVAFSNYTHDLNIYLNENLSSSHNHQQPVVAAAAAAAIVVVNPTSALSYSDRVVQFLQQSSIFDIIKKHNINLTSKQKDKINSIRNGGRSIYDRMCGDIELASIISQLEDSIMCYVPSATNDSTTVASGTSVNEQQHQQQQQQQQKINRSTAAAAKLNRRDYHHRNFQTKLRNFYRKLESKGYGQGPQKSKIVIKREKLLEDAKMKFMQLSKHDLRKNKIYICFHGEEGLDYGGPAREFFFLLSRELFNPYYGLFEYSASDMYTVQISPMSAFQEHALEWFQFAGRVLGIALIHQYLLDAFFTRPFYKALLKDTNWTMSDLETLDPEYCQSLMWIKENDITDVLDLTFSVTEDKFGQVVEHDLRDNGRNIAVTEKNKLEYLQRLVKWRVERGVQSQTEALVKGFYEVVDPKLVQTFDARELELVLCGTIEIDLHDWKRNTDYRSGYHPTHQAITWFWQAVEKFDNEQRLKLLQFVTGTSSIPYEGFAALRGSNGLRKFCIERWGTQDSLPRAHTCFNRLDLPPYPSFDILYEKLLLAIEETSGFSIQ